MLKKIATPITQSVHVAQKVSGLAELGITHDIKDALLTAAADLSTKQTIRITTVTSNPTYPELADVTLNFEVLGETISGIKLTIFVPNIPSESKEAFAKQIDAIEDSGMAWAKTSNLYTGPALKILDDTFCSALVHSAYPVSFDEDTAKFSSKESALLDKWIRALFANDEERDVFKLVESPSEVQTDNQDMMSRLSPRHGLESKESPSPTEINAICSSPSIFDQETISNGPGNSESNKIKAMREVLLEFKAIAGLVPDYFFTTLHDYFESTVLEAENQFELRWPSHAELETVKEDSSGSLHAIAAGAAVKRLDMAQLLENLTLKYIGRYSAKAVESHNDVNSHSKEIRQRLKKLVTLFNELDGRYTEFQPFLEAEVKTEDPSLYYLVKAYKAIAKINASVDVKKDPPNKLLLKYLEILPSFNRVDLYHHAGKSFAESYSLVAERGNESILEMTRRIKAHDAAIKVNSLVIPKGFRENRAEFIRQSHVWISICEGWGSQNIWEWEARRYNEGLVEMGGTSFVDKISWLKDQLEEPK